MATLTKECLEKLREKVDLVDLVQSYIELKRAGAYYKACCPFHEERTPSFVIQPGSHSYHCFGCSVHGDAIAFLMGYQHMTFVESVEFLAQRYGVELEYDRAPKQDSNKKRHLDLLQSAAQFYHQYLLNSEEGKVAMEYLQQRGIDQSFIKAFQIGLSPKEGKQFIDAMKREKFTQKELQETMLLNQYGSSFFFERIMFPICDARGRVVAFSARVYKEKSSGGKYINSKESYLFKKSHLLFGLNYSRMRISKGKKVLIVEGQIDALRLIHLGLNATVAPLGTALTEAHVEKLSQLGVEEAHLAFDSDEAGLNAAVKSGHLLQKKKITTYVVPIPLNSDPDSYLREKGTHAFAKLLSKKVDYLSFLLSLSAQRVDLNDPAKKARVVERVVEKIKEWEDPIMVHESLKKVATILQLPESALGLHQISTPHIFTSTSAHLKTKQEQKYPYIETDLLTWLLQPGLPLKKFLELVQINITSDHFIDPICKNIYDIMISRFKKEESVDTLSVLIESPDEKTQNLITELLEKKIKKEEAESLFIEALQRLLDRHWMNQREAIKVKVQSGVLSDEEALIYAKEFDEIQKKRPKVRVAK